MESALSFRKEFTLVVKGDPVAQARPRFSRSRAYNKQAHLLNSQQWEVAAQAPHRGIPLKGPISLTIDFVMPIPDSWSQKKKDVLEDSFHEKKPDIDNLLKWILDVLSGIVIADDRQICCVQCKKRYGKEPRTEIEVWKEQC